MPGDIFFCLGGLLCTSPFRRFSYVPFQQPLSQAPPPREISADHVPPLAAHGDSVYSIETGVAFAAALLFTGRQVQPAARSPAKSAAALQDKSRS